MDDLKNTVADWIRTARKSADLSQEELGSRLSLEMGEERGYTKANMSHWETQKHSPNLRQLAAIAKVTGVGLPPSLITAIGGSSSASNAESFSVSEALRLLPGARRIQAVGDIDTVSIRHIKERLHAGVTGFVSEPDLDIEEMLQLPSEVIRALNVDPAHLLVADIKGPSMEPMMFEGDKVLVDLLDRRPVSREVYALNFDGEGCVKQLIHRGGQWYLHSLNPDFGPINMRSGDCKIVGKVVYQPGRMLGGRL